MMPEPYDYLFKMEIVGDSGIGKSNIILRYVEDTYTESFISTIGVNFKTKNLLIGKKIVKIQIWDSVGQDKLVYRNFFSLAHAMIIAFDLTDLNSFNHVKDWVNNSRRSVSEKCKLILVGNKVDLVNERKVSKEQVEALKKELNIDTYFEVSAKNNTNIAEMFTSVTSSLVQTVEKNKIIEFKEKTSGINKTLLDALDIYIERTSRNYYAFKFPFFKQERGLQREANCGTAEKIRDGILSGQSLGAIFKDSDIENLRNEVINDRRLGMKPGYRKTGINSSELNKIILLARSSPEYLDTEKSSHLI